MTEFPAIRGRHREYPVHLSMAGRERFPKQFSIAIDISRGEMTFTGLIGKDQIRMTKQVME